MEIAGVELDNLELENIGSWPRRVRYGVIGIVLIALFVGAYYLNFVDQYAIIEKLQTEKVTLKMQFEKTQNEIANLEIYKIQVKKLQAELAKLSLQLPSNSEEAAFLEEISQLAALQGLEFRSIKPYPQQYKGFYIEQPVELIMRGDYHGLGNFVNDVSKKSRVITLHDLSIKTMEDKRKKEWSIHDLEITMMAKIYWVPK